MNSTFTNVSGDKELLLRLVDCWASLYGARAIVYRATKSLAEEPAIAVIVQEMIPSERSGVMFTVDPSDEGSKNLVIEGAFGQGEVVVSGQVEPDTYTLSREGPRLISTRIGTKDFKIVRGADGHDERIDLEGPAAIERVLSDEDVIDLAKLGLRAEGHYGSPQDMEWAIAGGRTYIVQSRPITTLESRAGHVATGRVLVTGLAASHGRGLWCGARPHEPVGGIEATQRRDPRRADDQPGLGADDATCRGSRHRERRHDVSRRHRQPRARRAVRRRRPRRDEDPPRRRDRDDRRKQGHRPRRRGNRAHEAGISQGGRPSCGRKAGISRDACLYVNLAMPEHAEQVAAMDVDGVGLLRAEFMVTDALGGEHPRALLERGDEKAFVDKMAEDMLRITRAFHPRPVVYRSIDFRTNEFANLTGGEQYERPESNPMIGYRGCFRYVKEPDLFGLELEILARVASQTPNIKLMIPFVRTRWELESCLEQVERSAIGGRHGLPVWVMAEVPSVAYWLPTYASMGVSGASIGSNDLTQLVLGVDRDSEICSELFDESDPAVIDAINRIISACRARRGLPRRCAAKLRRTTRHFASISFERASPPSRSTPTSSRRPERSSLPRNGASSSRRRAPRSTMEARNRSGSAPDGRPGPDRFFVTRTLNYPRCPKRRAGPVSPRR